ncbi:histidinol-phosphatase HisJ [Rossellomorea aquimaris]|uniref:histidinol-phosphatase HisJ n=1 Tax=Rossellomorea aquimaris TaxID=189382 RepID=UPI001CD3E83A|nr:histidinol-phosphatase HisJ [Rossellomorea aquimaris]MCA1056891.1 histidinol-phosphatase HisJ [Rossellomorea aquimaris]
MMKKVDGHIHTPFCPHGSSDSFHQYIERAISLQYSHLTFTEHAPLPEGFIDTTPDQDSGMDPVDVPAYFDTLDELKETYKDRITIRSGLEVDYIEGFEQESAAFLSRWGTRIDDSILSVHFLHHQNQWDCLDFSPEVFKSMIDRYGSVDAVYTHYYRTVVKSIESDLGAFKPGRIGHITLVKKFQHLYPASRPFTEEIEAILKAVAAKGLELDYNGAGLTKPHCGESYPPVEVIEKARSLGIVTVYGSDAHTANGINQGRDEMKV